MSQDFWGMKQEGDFSFKITTNGTLEGETGGLVISTDKTSTNTL